MTDTPTARMHIQVLTRQLYSRSPTGCCLHVFLDDLNTGREFALLCLKYAQERSCVGCVDLASAILALPDGELETIDKWAFDACNFD